jgi:hypothetical protein
LSPLLRVLAAGLLLIAVPGVQEVIEDAIHLIADGHTAHDAGHEDEQPGHCCSGLFHVCACHANAVAALVTELALPAAHCSPCAELAYVAKILLPGFRTPPFRPPTPCA